MTTDEARSTIDVRDRFRAVRIGKELALQLVPTGAPETFRDAPLVTHASSSPLLGEVATGTRRWVIDSGSCVDIVGEGSMNKKEKKIVEDMDTRMRWNTANGEVRASIKVKVSLNTATTADALIMKGCRNMLSLGKACLEEGFSFVWNSGEEAGPDPSQRTGIRAGYR